MDCIPTSSFHLSCGQSTGLPVFLYPFPPAHSPKRQPCGAWLTVFREKSFRKPAQAYRKTGFRHPCLSRPLCKCSLSDKREQELLSRFPIGKPSPLCSPPAGRSISSISKSNPANILSNNSFILFILQLFAPFSNSSFEQISNNNPMK